MQARVAKKLKQKEKQKQRKGTGGVHDAAAAANATAATADGAQAAIPSSGGSGMNRNERKRRLLSLNEDLAWCAKRKKLKRAHELFDGARAQGLAPDAHSWTNLVNCLARCGRPDEAARAVQQMRESGVTPNVVTYTALVKALCDAGDVSGAAAAMRPAEAGPESGRPNARTYNALLRGCVRVGSVGLGEQTLRRWWAQQRERRSDTPDGTAIEAVGHLLGQSLRPKAIASLVTLAGKKQVRLTPASRATMHLSAARAYALLGKRKAADAQLALLHAALETPDAPVVQQENAPSHKIDAASIEQFARHRRAELELDAEIVRAFVARKAPADMLGALTQRVISFLESMLPQRLDQHGRLHTLGAAPSHRLVVEVCAGSGEWICAQARAASDTQFVAVELRVDRGFNILARTLLEGAPNVAVVVGDAREVVTRRLAPSSVHAVCINHPEPPEWAGGNDDSDGAHLLDEAFLRAACALLAPGGTLAIVTDNKRYGRSLAEALTAIEGLRDLGDPSAPPAVRSGLPPASCGYVAAEASSFFDRLWANGKKKTRYHLAVAV